MKKRVTALWCVLALALTGGCAIRAAVRDSEPPEGSYQIYYAASGVTLGSTAVDFEYRVPDPNTGIVEGLLNLLFSGPEDESLTSPFPGGVTVQAQSLEDGVLKLDLSERYGELSGIDLTIANYCLTLTLCQAEGVEAVYITVEGKDMPYFAAKELRETDVVLTGDEEKPVYMDATLWFAQADGAGLGVEVRKVLKTEDDTGPKVVLDALLSGPGEGTGLLPLLAPETEVRSAAFQDGVCTVDFNTAFLEGVGDGDSAALRLYSVVNTLAGSLENVQAVQILVEGKQVSYMGGVPLSSPIKPDFSLERY